MVSLVIVILEEGIDLAFKITGQIVVFQNVYTDYTDIGLELYQRLNTITLHPA